MSNDATFGWALAVGATALGLAGVFIGRCYGPTAETYGVQWTSPPCIEVSEASPASLERVHLAVDRWREHDRNFGEIIKSSTAVARQGCIWIGPADTPLPEEHPATTEFAYEGASKVAAYAHIYLSEGPFYADDIPMLEHEIGHALGYAHGTMTGELMHPYYEQQGFIFPD
jgi:hypothetical protein